METKAIQINFSNQDLTRLIVPLVIKQLLVIMLGLLDSLMVSWGARRPSRWREPFSTLATGGAAIVGQYLGRQKPEKAGHAGEQLLLFMIEVS